MKSLSRIVMSAAMIASAAAPALALDYEAKPIQWCIQAPFRTVGAVSGALMTGLVSGPIDGAYHGALKGTTHVAGKFGDDKGVAQRGAGAMIGAPPGMVLGTVYESYKGFGSGWKKGWDKPFSRWSYITMEEK